MMCFLQALLRSALPIYMEAQGWGLVLLLISAIFSRGLNNVRADMDDPSSCFLGGHGYCTQELVHLLLIGASDTFLDASALASKRHHAVASRLCCANET
jgi:hypothetical protein